jgi:hypothetical protein
MIELINVERVFFEEKIELQEFYDSNFRRTIRRKKQVVLIRDSYLSESLYFFLDEKNEKLSILF